MVTLARYSRQLTQEELATKIGVQQGTLSKLENGAFPIEEHHAAAISEALDYPVAFFYRHDAFEGPGILELYHARKRKAVKLPVLNRAYAAATIRRMHVETLLRSYEQAESAKVPIFPADEYGDAERVARTVRAQLSLPPGPIYSMTEAVESSGGIIVPCEFGSQYIDGFTRLRRPNLPALFFINRELAPDRWRWTLAHELGHAVMHTGQEPSDTAEQEADAFAQEFLLPRQVIKGQLINLNFSKLAGLKAYWKVSIQALIMRAHSLSLISDRQRSYMFMQWSRAGYRIREPAELDPPQEPPRALTELIAYHIRRLGYTIAELAEALDLFEAEFRAYYLPGQPSLLAPKQRRAES